MITIGKPYIKHTDQKVQLCAPITICGNQTEAWFSVDEEYEQFLTEDRSDAFVVGFLTTAMRMGEDILCEAPITKRLYYQLTTYLIPTMASAMEIYHPITLHAEQTEVPLPCQKAVATGWTGGVDCMYTLMTHLQAEEPSRRLTHLLIANVGTLEGEHNTELLHHMIQKTKNGIAAQAGLKVVGIDSNLHLLQSENYLAVAAFRLPAAVLALQKLFGVFLNSAGYEFSRFAFNQENSAYYELLPLSCFETDCTVFYSTGGQTPRIKKLQELADFSYAQRYLHPCIYQDHDYNCGKCGKCIRTLGALYAIGKLESFGAVFDIEGFYQNKNEYLLDILSKGNSQHYGEVLNAMKQRGIEMPPEVLRLYRIRRAATAAAKKYLE